MTLLERHARTRRLREHVVRRPQCNIYTAERGHHSEVASSPPTFRSVASNGTNSNTSNTVNVPTGTSNGDLLLLALAVAATSAMTTPTGWTAVTNRADGANASKMWIYSRIASSEPASYTFTCPADSAAIIYCVQGGLGLVDAGPTTAGSLSSPTVTTAVANALVVRFGGGGVQFAAGPVMTWPNGSTMRATVRTGASFGSAGISVADRVQAAAGATGTEAYTVTNTASPYSCTLSIK